MMRGPLGRTSNWKDHDHWQCLKHVPPVILPETSPRCWFAGCSTRPPEEDRPAPAPVVVVPEVLPPEVPSPAPATERGRQALTVANALAPLDLGGRPRCALDTCTKPARPGSKYCSRVCSNRNARRRFMARARVARRAARAAAAASATATPELRPPNPLPAALGGPEG
jgi:hypothetical protein